MASIQMRKTNDGETSYRVQIRMKGFPAQRATFKRLTDAKAWARNTETSIAEGRYFKTSEAKRHTVNELIDRYGKKIQKENPKRYLNIKPMLEWWGDELGDFTLADLNGDITAPCCSSVDTLGLKYIPAPIGPPTNANDNSPTIKHSRALIPKALFDVASLNDDFESIFIIMVIA